MIVNEAAADELRQIRQACHDLGADEEMTALVMASHRHDRTRLDVMLADGSDLMGYVRHKLAIWEAILTDTSDDPIASAESGAPRRGGVWE
jgi:hypothetical protein